VDVRIGVTQSPREIEVELPDDVDVDALRAQIEGALGEDGKVLWLTDRRGRQVAVSSVKIAYVEIGSPSDKGRIGFG
jgi:hypothetical protein